PDRDRHRRHHRAPLGPQDRGARHLPRSSALLAWSFRQDQRLALARGDGHGSRTMDPATLGSAVSHHPRPFRTLRRRPRASTQEADGLGAPSHSPGSPMGAKPQNRRRRRFQLLGARSDRRGSPPCLSRHEAAPRRQSVRAGAGAPPRTARTPAQKRSAIALIIAERDAIVPARRSAPLRTAIRYLVLERAIDAGHNDLYDHPE